MFYTRVMEQEPGKKNLGENPWDQLREPEQAPEKTEELSDAKKAKMAEHILTQSEMAELAREYMRQDSEAAPGRAKERIGNMVDTQRAFEKQLERIAARGSAAISRKEFEAWEDDFAFDWDQAHQEMKRGKLDKVAQQAEIEYPIMMSDGPTLEKTIEAQAGHFFFERSEALSQAIQSSEDPKRAEDLKRLGSFYTSVQKHLDFKYTETRYMDTWEATSYDRQRTQAHNDLIRHLNELNALAKKYGTRPFTMRDFWTSDGVQSTNAIKQRMRHDRHQVEAYCRNAFTRLDESARRRAERNSCR